MPNAVPPGMRATCRSMNLTAPAWPADPGPVAVPLGQPHRGGVLVTARVVAVLVGVAVVLLTPWPEGDIRDEMGTTLSRMRSGDEA